MLDLQNDPAYNDDSQPSVTTAAEALRKADEMAGVVPPASVVRAPADAMDVEHRVAVAETTTSDELDRLGAEAGPEPIAEPSDETAEAEGEDTGTGSYEDRTAAQLQALARSRGLATSGSKADLIERLRA